MTLRCLGVGRDRWARRERVAAGPAVPPYLRQRHFFRKFSIGSTANIDDQYTTNALNQYTAKENNAVRFLGTAATDANVALAGISSTAKKDRAWGSDLVAANTNAAVAGTATIYAAKPGGGGGGTDLVRSETKSFFIPKGLQTFTYDDDGNLLSDGVWDYTYDAENRLASMQHRAEVIGAGMIATANARRLEFKYDYQGRRVRKTVYHQWNGTTYSATPLSDTKYFYVGWNLTAEFVWNPSTSTFDLNRSFTWGLDLTGSLTAAGGVGALLQMHDYAGTGKTLLPAYDGNGNVTALLNADTGALEAAYEYDPFGNPLRAEGTYAKDNPFRFSTKFTDEETGLVYYGLRYYSPSLGRFVNRDPIEESGGLNLYGFAGNNAVNAIDLLGMIIVSINGRSYDVNYLPGRSFTPRIQSSLPPGSMWTTDPRRWGLSFSIFFSPFSGFGFSVSPFSYVFVATPIASRPPAAPPPIVSPQPQPPARSYSYKPDQVKAYEKHFPTILDRSAAYDFMDGDLQRRGIDVRWFKAAQIVTSEFLIGGVSSSDDFYGSPMKDETVAFLRRGDQRGQALGFGVDGGG